MISFNRDQNREAKDSFIKALNIGPRYDIRIKKTCVEQLRKLYAAENLKFEHLEHLAMSFKHVNRDFIFLVNQSCRGEKNTRNMVNNIDKVRKTLHRVLDNKDGAIEAKDRISLITYAKNVRRIFSLVAKEQNFVQLRNQIKILTADKEQEANLLKALSEASKEFSEQDRTKKWIVCFTNEINEKPIRDGISSLSAIADKFARLQINLIFVCYHLREKEKQMAIQFVNQIKQKRQGLRTCEAFFCPSPSMGEQEIENRFMRIANYKLEYY